jgi:hypothetical protein
MAKGFKSGGRKRGTPNRATSRAVAEFLAAGLSPLEFLLSVMRNDEYPLMLRVDAAGKAAQYVHPKLAQVEHSGSITRTDIGELTMAELDQRIAALTESIDPTGIH